MAPKGSGLEGGRKMSQEHRTMGLVAFIIFLPSILLLSTFSSPIIQAIPPEMDARVMDSELRRMIPGLGDDEPMDVIIQFHGGVRSEDQVRLKALGFELKYKYKVLPAVHAVGTVKGVRSLSLSDRVLYIENNARIEHDMDLSTTVINATRAWTTKVEGLYPNKPYIDGTGIAAVVVDTGIDAGHPDLDYGEKTIINQYLETEGQSWKEAENTDLYYGHGTHVAGTVGGNGDASAGGRRGVAPGVSLIGVTIWDPTMAEYLVGEEWVYENSRPNNNPHNIRVATNSWHTIEDEYENESALSQIIMKLAYENNVVTTWSAGNEGRTDPEGTTVTTSIEGNTPAAIMVAAYERDGSAVTDFSSRGEVGKPQTYPDIGAPGRSIWSTSARRTVISGGTYSGGNTNPYYLAISGTSMSTPHLCGLVALLWEAAPSLKVSERHEDFAGTPEEEKAWKSNPFTRIHEIEWILEVTSTYLPPSEETGVNAEDNSTGADGQPIDYAQGYGIVNAEYAVGVALTLERLRQMHPDKDITVADALRTYQEENIIVRNVTEAETDNVYTMWDGEYSRYNDQFGAGLSAVNQTRFVWAPAEAETAIIDMKYAPVNLDTGAVGDITFTIDTNGDGSADVTGPLYGGLQGYKQLEMPVQDGGRYWAFDIIGQGFRFHLPRPSLNYVELRIEYHIGVTFMLKTNGTGLTDATDFNGTGAMVAHLYLGEPSLAYESGSVALNTQYYDLTKAILVPDRPPPGKERARPPIAIIALAIVAAVIVGYLFSKRRRSKTMRRRP